MRCLHCRIRLSFFEWLLYSNRSLLREREVTCRRCGAVMRDASRLAQLGMSLGGITLGAAAALGIIAALPLPPQLTLLVLVGVGCGVGLVGDYAFASYELADSGPRGELPPSRLLRPSDGAPPR